MPTALRLALTLRTAIRQPMRRGVCVMACQAAVGLVMGLLLGVTSVALAESAEQAPASAKPYEADDATALLYHLDEAAGATHAIDAVAGRNATISADAKLGEATLKGLNTGLRPQPSLAGRVTFVDRGMGDTTFLLPANTPSLTIEAWVRLDETDFERDRIIVAVQPAGTATSDYSLAIFDKKNQWHAGGLYLRDNRSAVVVFTQGGLKWDAGQWYHVALVIEPDQADPAKTSYKLYRTPAGQKDPLLVARKTDTPLVARDSQADRQFEIGNFYGSNGQQCFPGLIDEVRFSVVARQPADFTTLRR